MTELVRQNDVLEGEITTDLPRTETEPQGYIEYSSNNSGGGWWLTDDDWAKLEAAGWVVDWFANEVDPFGGRAYEGGRWLGALARSARRYGVSMRMAVAEWEDITLQDSDAGGCPCCGQPHYFSQIDANGNYVF
jgi:hypothetical protein